MEAGKATAEASAVAAAVAVVAAVAPEATAGMAAEATAGMAAATEAAARAWVATAGAVCGCAGSMGGSRDSAAGTSGSPQAAKVAFAGCGVSCGSGRSPYARRRRSIWCCGSAGWERATLGADNISAHGEGTRDALNQRWKAQATRTDYPIPVGGSCSSSCGLR